MKDTVRTALAIAYICTLASATVTVAPMSARAQSIGEKANQAVDEVTKALKRELLKTRLENFSAADEWTTALLNQHLTSDQDFNRFLTDDAFATDTLSKMETAKIYIEDYARGNVSERVFLMIMSQYFPNVFSALPNLAS